ncbi:mediator of hyperadherence YidE [Yersinia enterocolitica]|nr:mediator of hyperadherence YidE [Yersinia enterocolitica]
MSAIALTVSMLALVAVLGLWIGNWKVYGVGLGIGGGYLAALSWAILHKLTNWF